MPIRRLVGQPSPPTPPLPCTHPDHDPPALLLLEPGVYEHVCQGCGRRTVFVYEPTVSIT